ncbi:MAG: tetratricopeptide repeat protein [Bacteroidota bacterium]
MIKAQLFPRFCFLFSVLVILFLSPCLLFAQEDEQVEKFKKEIAELGIGKQRTNVYVRLAVYYYNTSKDSSKAFPLFRKAIADAEELKSDTLTAYTQYMYADAMLIFNKYDQAMALAEKINPSALDYKNHAATLYALKGRAYNRMGRYTESVEWYLKALNTITDTSAHTEKGMIHLGIGFSLGMSGNKPQVIEHFKQALREMQLAGKEQDIARVYVALSNVEDIGPEKEAHLREALKIYSRTKNYFARANVMIDFASLAAERKNFKEAIPMLNKALQLFRDSANIGLSAPFFMAAARIHKSAKDFKRASLYCDSVIGLAGSSGMRGTRYDAYILKADLLELLGRPAEANRFLHLHYNLKDSIYHFDREQILQDAYTKYKTELKEKENQNLKKDLQIESDRKKLLVYLVIGLVLIAGLLLAVIAYRRKSVQQAQKLAETLARENELLGKSAAVEKENLLMKQETLKSDLEKKSVLLSNLTVYMVRKNEVITSVKESIRNLEINDNAFRRIVEDVNVFIDVKSEWDEFMRCFEDVNPGFFDKLNNMCPDLTQRELKMCSYIKMNMDVKQISNLLNITDGSVHNSRSKLRKRLNLDADADLNSVIMKL